MGDQPALAVDDEGVALVADADGADDVPDQFQVHVGDGHAGLLADMGERNRHVGLRAAAKFDRTEPDFFGDGLREARVARKILAAADRIRFEAGDPELLLALAVEIGKLGDRGNLPQQPDEIVALLVGLGEAPFGARRPSELGLDVGQKFADANGGRPGLFLLNLEGGAFRLIVIEPGVDRAVDQENENDQSDQRRREFRGERQTPRPARWGRARARRLVPARRGPGAAMRCGA